MRDDFDAVVADRFRVLDQVPVPDTWSLVQRSGQMQAGPASTEEAPTMVDLETSVPNESRRKGPIRVVVAAVVAAAAVVAIALVATRDDGRSPIDETPSTVTTTPPPPTPARALFGSPGEALEPGTYYVDAFEGVPTARVQVTLGNGWTNTSEGWGIGSRDDTSFITFSRPDAVLSDICHPSAGYSPEPLTTLDGLVTALTEQQGWAESTTPSDIAIDGYLGKAFERTAPTDVAGCTRESAPPPALQVRYPLLSSWENVGADGRRGWSYYQPGDRETLWVLDIDGTIVILSARVEADQPAAAHDELAAVLDSIRIDRT